MKARYRLGPELEICGYGCEDHFLENDTYNHCWTVIEWIIKENLTNDIICDFGIPSKNITNFQPYLSNSFFSFI